MASSGDYCENKCVFGVMVAWVGSITIHAFLCPDPRPRDSPALPGCVQPSAYRHGDRQQGSDCSWRNLRPNGPGLPQLHRETEGTQDSEGKNLRFMSSMSSLSSPCLLSMTSLSSPCLLSMTSLFSPCPLSPLHVSSPCPLSSLHVS